MSVIKKVIAVDHGNHSVKSCNNNFCSGLTESESRPPFGEYLYFKEKYYMLCEQRIPYMRDKTTNDKFFVLTLFAIAMELERDLNTIPKGSIIQVDLPIGLPPKHFGQLYKKFEQYFKRDEILNFTFRGRDYSICINQTLALPQDYAAAMTIYKSIVEYSKAIVIDIGGFTVDYLLLRNGKSDMSVCESLENGIIILYNKVKSIINSEHDILLDDADIDSIIMENCTDFDNLIIKTVRNMTESFTDDLLGILREHGLNLRTGCNVFVGGGALLLRNYLEKSDKVGKCIFIEDIQANAKGYRFLYDLQSK